MAFATEQECTYAAALGISVEEALARIGKQREILAESPPLIVRRAAASTPAEHAADRKAGAKVLRKARGETNRRIAKPSRYSKSEYAYGEALGITTEEAAVLCKKHREILASSPAIIYRRLAA